ncbi:MFS transporter [Sphingosinicella terrae]|uniref:MFS transporter n=1 Tax=Sphingosinicella terrae TaxID=2172047 RepID=UPI0032D8EB12
MLSPLRHPVFRAIWIASLASNFGGMIQSVGAAWMMTSISGSADMVALVSTSVTLPIMLLSLFSGAAADNFDRRRMMLFAQSFMLLVSVGLAAATWLGWITPWLLLLFTFLIGCGAAMNGPAWQASVGDMVSREDLPSAIALNSMGFNIARSLGPAIGGAIVAAAGAVIAFLVNAVSYIGLLAVLLRWRPVRHERRLPRERMGVAIVAGIRYAAMSPAIGLVLGRSLVFGFGASAVSALMPLIARDLVGGGPLTFGLLLGAFGGGAVAGALLSARLRLALTTERIVRWSCLAFAAGALAAAASRDLVPTMGALFFAGAAWVLALSTFNVTVQLNSPRWVVARALSLYQMAAFGGMAGGAWTWGSVADAQDVPTALIAASLSLIVCAAIGFRLPLPDAGAVDLDPRPEWRPPDTAIDIQPRSGPVVVAVEFLIREEDIPEFLQAMRERRLIRRRSGARRWTLLRDVADPQLWIERFQVPNWVEYIRHNNRITEAELAATGRARELHIGPEPPHVRRMIERPTDWLPKPKVPVRGDLDTPLTDPRMFG